MGRSLSTPELNAGVSNIASAAGFTAGDYVYQQRTDTGPVPAGALATGAFAYNNIPSATFPGSSTASSNLIYDELSGGTYASNCAAKLNNGNIVLVYTKNTPGTYIATAYFKIVDSSGTVVVAETAVSGATVAGFQQVAVCTLPNNNFAVVWTNQQAGVQWYMTFRIYSQTGAAVTGATTSTAIILYSNSANQCIQLKVKPRSDNSFIMMATDTNTGAAIFFAGSQAGFVTPFNGATGYYSRSFYNGGYQFIDFVITPDDKINIFYSPNAVRIDYDIRNADGTASSSGIFTSNVSGIYALSCCLMPSGTINVVSTNYNTPNGGIQLYSWNGTTATYVGRIVSFTTVGSQEVPLLHAYTQGASGNFTIFYNHTDTAGALAYQTFNSSGTPLSGSTPFTVPAISYLTGGRSVLSVFDIGTSTRVYLSNRSESREGVSISSYLGNPRGIFYFSYDSTTYATNKVSTANYTYGSLGSFALGAYVKSQSTPIEASFTIGATGSYSTTVAAGTNLINKVVVSASTAYAISAMQMQNGNFAIAWTSGAGTLNIRTYTPAGVQVSEITASSTIGSNGRFCGMAPFSNGNFVIIWQSSTAATLLYKIYNQSLVEQFSGTVTTTASIDNMPLKPQMCAYGDGNQVAIAYRLSTASNFYEIKELTSANVLTTITTGSGTQAQDAKNMQLVPYRGAGFGFIYREGLTARSQYQFVQVWKTGATTWTVTAPANIPNSDDAIDDNIYGTYIPGPSNNSLAIVNSGDTRYPYIYNYEPALTSGFNRTNPSTTNDLFRTDSSTTHALGYTGNGAGVWAVTSYQSSTNRIYYVNARPASNSIANLTAGPIYNSGYFTNGSLDNKVISIAPHVEGACVIAFIDNDGYPAFFVPVVQTCTISRTLTAGTDVSTSKLALTPEAGYVLRGIALTNASAGGSGLVQTKGVASVSASYQSVTPTMNFDFRISTANGVRGSITGRTVTLEN